MQGQNSAVQKQHGTNMHQGGGHTGLTATPAANDDSNRCRYGESAELAFHDGIGIGQPIIDITA